MQISSLFVHLLDTQPGLVQHRDIKVKKRGLGPVCTSRAHAHSQFLPRFKHFARFQLFRAHSINAKILIDLAFNINTHLICTKKKN